jgi:pyruvate formate lyase activating enzyme
LRFKGVCAAFRKTTLVDYPGRVAAALFFPGCNLRCPWCQNRELVLAGQAGSLENAVSRVQGLVSLEDALAHIRKRLSVLGGVVISGGEPTLYRGLAPLIGEIKSLGLPVKLDTNGLTPLILEKLFANETTRPSYIALDLKLPPERYGELLPQKTVTIEKDAFNAGEALVRSALLIRESGIAREYRTLALPGDYLRPEELTALAPLVDGGPWYFRTFVPGNCLESAWDDLSAPGAEKAELLAEKARLLGKQGISR